MRILLCMAALLLLGACASSSLTLHVVAIEPVNVADGESRVVEVRVFLLRSDTRFNQATADNIWIDAQAALGDTLIETRTGITVFPGRAEAAPEGRRIVIDPVPAEARFVGLLALFSETDDKGDRKVVLPVSEAGKVTFQLTGYHVEIRS